jgi:hypothetical protein
VIASSKISRKIAVASGGKNGARTLFTVTLLMLLSSLFLVQLAKAYDNTEFGYSITPPNGWTKSEATSGVFTIITFASPEIGQTGQHVSMSVIVENADMSLYDYVLATEQNLSTQLSDYSLVSKTIGNVAGFDCYQLIVTYNVQQQSELVAVKVADFIILENSKAYVIQYVARSANYYNYYSTFEQSLQTFQLADNIPEFPSWSVMLVMLTVIAVAVASYKRKLRPQTN